MTQRDVDDWDDEDEDSHEPIDEEADREQEDWPEIGQYYTSEYLTRDPRE